jgi:hypothetical protein
MSLRVPVFTLLCIASLGEVAASQVRQMTFEEVATQAAVIVRGRVTTVPETAIYDRTSRQVYLHNRVHVDEYLKGTGPTHEIEVLTLGGQFDTEGLGLQGPRIQFVDYGGAPQLPPPYGQARGEAEIPESREPTWAGPPES